MMVLQPKKALSAPPVPLRAIRLAYVSILPSDNLHAWSGLNYHIAKCLRDQGVEVVPIAPLHSVWRSFVSKAKAAVLTKLTGRRHLWTRDTSLLRFYARLAAERIARAGCDAVFSPGTEPLAYLPDYLGLPVVFWTDAPFAAMLDYYPWYRNLAPATILEGTRCDNRALGRASVAIYSSSWAADHAIELHGASPQAVKVVPFGANLDCSLGASSMDTLVRSRLRRPWRFLFVGVEWERKGGDIVLAVITELNRRGYPSELCIVGCAPPSLNLPRFVTVQGFIDKRTPAGREKMAELYRSTTFFFMPSRAEAYGIVFCEACAYGVPSLTTQTGGIPTIIRDGYNGRLFPIDAPVEEYVTAILAAVKPLAYRELCSNALAAYEQELNWEVSGRRVVALIHAALDRQSVGHA